MPTRASLLPPFLSPFVVAGFAGLWVSASSGAFARVVTQLVLSWIMLETTGSPFMVGVVSAARSVPQLLLGIPAGALADWADRRMTVIVVNSASVVLLLTLVPMVAMGILPPIALVAVSALYGALDTLRMAATQAYAYDLVRTSRATSGMALTNLGVQLLSMLGGLAGGYTLDHYGTVATFGLIALALLAAVLGPALGGRPVVLRTLASSPESHLPSPQASSGGRGIRSELAPSLRMLLSGWGLPRPSRPQRHRRFRDAPGRTCAAQRRCWCAIAWWRRSRSASSWPRSWDLRARRSYRRSLTTCSTWGRRGWARCWRCVPAAAPSACCCWPGSERRGGPGSFSWPPRRCSA